MKQYSVWRDNAETHSDRGTWRDPHRIFRLGRGGIEGQGPRVRECETRSHRFIDPDPDAAGGRVQDKLRPRREAERIEQHLQPEFRLGLQRPRQMVGPQRAGLPEMEYLVQGQVILLQASAGWKDRLLDPQ